VEEHFKFKVTTPCHWSISSPFKVEEHFKFKVTTPPLLYLANC